MNNTEKPNNTRISNVTGEPIDNENNNLEDRFYDNMPEGQLERLLQVSLDENKIDNSSDHLLSQNALSQNLLSQKKLLNEDTASNDNPIITNPVITDDLKDSMPISLEVLKQQALHSHGSEQNTANLAQSKSQDKSQNSTVKQEVISAVPERITLESDSIVDTTLQQSNELSTLNKEEDAEAIKTDCFKASLADDFDNPDTFDNLDTFNNLDTNVHSIEQTIHNIRAKLEFIANESKSFNTLTTQLIEQMRHLQQMGEDDFSVTYEQVYQLRSCLFETRRSFNEIPNFLDMVEHAWENDIYTAQMRQKFINKNR